MDEGERQHQRRRMELKEDGQMLVQLNSPCEPYRQWNDVFIPLVTAIKVYSNRDCKVGLSTATRIEKQNGMYGFKVDEYVGNI